MQSWGVMAAQGPPSKSIILVVLLSHWYYPRKHHFQTFNSACSQDEVNLENSDAKKGNVYSRSTVQGETS